jgi:hypothetical protein
MSKYATQCIHLNAATLVNVDTSGNKNNAKVVILDILNPF